MKVVWQIIYFWRYLLLAGLVVAGTVEYMVVQWRPVSVTAELPLQPSSSPSVDEESAVVVKGLRFSIHSLAWKTDLLKNDVLKVVFQIAFVSVNGSYPGRHSQR
jgi:hypothetical protein